MEKVHISHLGELSPNAFLKAIEKRVRREVRTKYPFSKGDNILIIDDSTNNAFVAQDLLKNILQTMPVKTTVKQQASPFPEEKDMENFNKIIIPWNADDELQNFLGELFEKKQDTSPKGIKLIECLLKSEVDAYAQIKGFQGKQQTSNKTLENLEKRFPGGKFALLKSKNIIKSNPNEV